MERSHLERIRHELGCKVQGLENALARLGREELPKQLPCLGCDARKVSLSEIPPKERALFKRIKRDLAEWGRRRKRSLLVLEKAHDAMQQAKQPAQEKLDLVYRELSLRLDLADTKEEGLLVLNDVPDLGDLLKEI